MQIQENINLSSKTTFKIGGIVKKLYIPEDESELITISEELYDKDGKIFVLSGGSNLLINDNRVFESIISISSLQVFIDIPGFVRRLLMPL